MMEDLTLEKRLKEEKCPGGPPTSVLGNLGMWRNYSLEWEAKATSKIESSNKNPIHLILSPSTGLKVLVTEQLPAQHPCQQGIL